MKSAYIHDASITTAKIANAAVQTAHIDDAQITAAKIANLAVESAKIADAAITTAKIGSLAVSTLKLANESVSLIGTVHIVVAGASGSTTFQVYMAHAGTISVVTSATVAGTYSSDSSSDVKLYKDGAVIFQYGGSFGGVPASMYRPVNATVNVAAGWHTFEYRWTSSNVGNTPTLVALGSHFRRFK
jgi:hypothetical protein